MKCYDPFYRFLDDDYFDYRTSNNAWRAAEPIKEMTPHEIYRLKKGDLSKNLQGVGPKKEAVILQRIEAYKPHHLFCACGEPLLDWYQYCPVCGYDIFGGDNT